ncbi:M15 family metallopeptidase [Candidatus Dojkabacteria bacterium]|jgi:peptidoglycan L-alanyl-D-glutamate endopeptidase CwlK|nr:M15 family metallopeptidase [Candidatus Dojkabacteria bacterium]
MPVFSTNSKNKLLTCSPTLQVVANELVKYYDFTVTSGYRGEAEQNECYKNGTSDLKFPHSLHNVYPSRAFDLAPYVNGAIPWEKEELFCQLSGALIVVARQLNLDVITWGGSWKKPDLPHYQLKMKG